MPLTDTFIRQVKWSGAKAGDKYSDGGGMYLHVTEVSKYWRMNYRYSKKQKTLALGVYPTVSLAAARLARVKAREQLASGIDPSAAKQSEQDKAKRSHAASFETLAREWLATSSASRGDETNGRVKSWFERDVFPLIGTRPIDGLRGRDILDIMEMMQKRGIIDSMHRVLGYISKVFRLAIVRELADRDPTVGIREQLEKPKAGNFAAITEPRLVAPLLRSIHGYHGHPYCRTALKLAPLVFVRPGELRQAEWSEIDLESAEWRIPAAKMKMDNDHIVPLARQAVEILRELREMTGRGRYAFPSIRSGDRAMSENTINAALRSMGYTSDMMTGHGFRAMARTILDEVLHERVDLIEHQLGHAVKDVNGRAYNRTTHLPARRAMMQRWADYLDELRKGVADE